MSKAAFKKSIAQLRREAAEHVGRVMMAFEHASEMGSSAIRGAGYGDRPMMAIKSGEISDTGEGKTRVTFFGTDGPHGHVTRKYDAEIAEETAQVLRGDIQPMSDNEVIAWTTTPEYERGSRVIAFTQAENALRYRAQKAGRLDWAYEVIRHANEVGTEDGKHRGTPDTIDTATQILVDAMKELPRENPIPNPGWVTEIISDSYELLEERVPPEWLPKLSFVRAGRGVMIAEMPEYGCGVYGCVLPTLDPTMVLKVTTDVTEAQFAAEFADTIIAPIVTTYRMVIHVSGQYKGRPIYLLWREAAEDVGQIGRELGRAAVALIDRQHAAAQAALRLIAEGRDIAAIRPKIIAWLDTCEAMATQDDVPELKPLGRGLAGIYHHQQIFFGDVHAGNVGRVVRDGRSEWVITDPGNVVVIDVF